VDHLKTYSAPPVSTKLHSSYHLNPSQPDYAMWQSSSFKSIQPSIAMCHYPIKPPATTVAATIMSHLLSARKPWQQRRRSCTSSRNTITTKHPPFTASIFSATHLPRSYIRGHHRHPFKLLHLRILHAAATTNQKRCTP